MFARRARRRFELATRTADSPKSVGGGRGRGKPKPTAAKKRGAAEDADEDEAGVRNGAGGKKPKVHSADLSDGEDD